MTQNKLIEQWSSSLTDRLVEIRFIDVSEIKAAIASHIKAALYDCLQVQITETERKLNEMKVRYTERMGVGNNAKVQSELIRLKEKLKRENKLFASLETENKNKELVLYLRKHNEPLLLSFYEYYNNVVKDGK